MASWPGWVMRSLVPADAGLVDPLLDDLVADVVRPVYVEALLVDAEADRERLMLDEDQVGRFEGNGHVGLGAGELPLDPAGRHELPDPEVAQIELIEEPVLVELESSLPFDFFSRENAEFDKRRIFRRKWSGVLMPGAFLALSGVWLATLIVQSYC